MLQDMNEHTQKNNLDQPLFLCLAVRKQHDFVSLIANKVKFMYRYVMNIFEDLKILFSGCKHVERWQV